MNYDKGDDMSNYDWGKFRVKREDLRSSLRYQRYIAIENLHPGSFVLERVGDFYEILGEKAKEAAEVLDLLLTSRDVGLNDRVPMCGFPFHAAKSYIDKLTEHGAVCLADETDEEKRVIPQKQSANSNGAGSVMAEFADNEPNPFDSEPASLTPETVVSGDATKKKVGIKDRRCKRKPQLSLFDLIEAKEKSEKELLIERSITYGSGGMNGKFRIIDRYNENPTAKEFAQFLKTEYGVGGHIDAEESIHYDSRGIRMEKGETQAFLSWSEIVGRIADLIDDDAYLSETEKEVYQAYHKERNEAARRNTELIDRVITRTSAIRKSRIAAAYSTARDRMQFADQVQQEYGYSLETYGSCIARYDSNGVVISEVDERGNIKLEIHQSWSEFADRIHAAIERGDYSDEHKEPAATAQAAVHDEHADRIRSIVDRIVSEGTTNTSQGNWVTFFDEFADEEEFVVEHREQIADALGQREEVAEISLDENAFDVVYYLDYCPNLEHDPEAEPGEEEAHIPAVGDKYLIGNREITVSDLNDQNPAEVVVTYTEQLGDCEIVIEHNLDADQLNDENRIEPTISVSTGELPEPGGPKTRFKNNIAAIRLANFLDERNAMATDAEKITLSRFVGWGGLSQAFDDRNAAWHREYEELKALLAPEDYEQARSSVLNSFYTPKEIVTGIYSGLGRIGVRGSILALEPAMGIGSFFKHMPEEVAANAKLYGVELDRVTGRIASKLYPEANIQIKGFEETSFPDDMFDIVVGNVPFGGYGVYDSAYNRYNFRIHDYFIAKSIDKTRPGGIVAIVTSKGTMDKQNQTARNYAAERAELIGAIRLPNTAFKSTAGTEAVADILFFRKRPVKINDLSDERWLELGETTDGLQINQYFIEHPEMVLGTIAKEQGLYGGIGLTVNPDGRELGEAIAEAVKRLPENVYQSTPARAESASVLAADYSVKQGGYAVRSGKLYQRIGDVMEEVAVPQVPKNALTRISAMINLKDALRHVLEIQKQGCSDEVLAAAQVRLNARYDAFVEAYGHLNDKINVRLFRDDAESAFLFACESVDEKSGVATKEDIFTKRTIRPYSMPVGTQDCHEALHISQNERGKVDIAYIEELTGKNYEEVVAELGNAVFRDPMQIDHDDKYSGFVSANEYLSGKVKDKLAFAERMAADNPEFQKNVEALREVQPEPIRASDIAVRLGATWVDKKYYEQFYSNVISGVWWAQRDVELFYNPFDSSWRLDQTDSVRRNGWRNQRDKFGTQRAPAYRLFVDCLNLKATTICDTVEDENGKKKQVVNQAETIAAREKQNKIKEAFQDWIFADPDRRDELEATYNRLFNRIRLQSYDGSYLTFPEKNPEIKLRPHQVNAVERIMMSDGSVLLHHVVGSGKTFTGIASIMKMRQLGICNKAMVVVPNHLVQQWAGDWRRLYPLAKILVATKEDLEKNNRRRFVSKVALGDWDGIIIAESSFGKIAISPERQINKIRSEINGIEASILQQRSNSQFPQGSVKNLERIKKSKEAQLKSLMSAEHKDDLLLFEDLGVDYLFVDEAQDFKNLFLFTKMNNVSGISGAASQRASDLKLKCEYLQELHGSDRGVVFLTGTPISNSMTEMYTMQTYLQPSVLKELGMQYFDGWAANFGETVTSMELSPSGQGYRAKTRFSKFTNLPELLTLYRSFADVQTGETVKLDVPTTDRKVIALTPSEEVIRLSEEIAERAERISGGRVDPSVDNMLKITSDGKKLALDPRLYAPEASEAGDNKLNECAKRIFETWADTAEIKGTQIVFCDLSTPKKRFEDYEHGKDFDVYNELKYKLVARGIPADEVAYIHDAKNDQEKQALFDRVNDGDVRVLIGSTAKCGAGTNVQQRLVALHHLDTPYRPADMEQREGRIVRQGNTNEQVKIFTYVTERTFDSYSYQILENKQRFISQINRGDLTVREAEDIDETTLSYAEIKAITAANPKIKRKMEVDAEVSRLRLLEGRYKKNLYELQDKIRKDYPERIRLQEQGVERIHADLKMLDGVERGGNHFSISVNGVTYTDRKDGGRALTQALYASTPMTFVAEYCGFKICMKPIGLLLPGDREITLSAEGNYTIPIGESPSGNLIRIDNFIQDFADRAKRMENRLRELHAEFEAAQEQVLQPFEHTARLSALLAEQSQLNAELDLNRHEEIIVDDNDENSAVYSVSETDQTEPAATEADLTENELIEEIAVDTAETTKENGVVIKNAEHPVHPGSDQMIGQGVNDPDLSTLAAEIIVLDTETTGLNIADELLQVSILDGNGGVLYDSYIKPTKVTSWPEAEKVNHITPETVKIAPRIQDELPKIDAILRNAKKIIGYNTSFDLSFLTAAGATIPENIEIVDVMEDFAQIYGEYSETYGGNKWQNLSTCASYYGYDWPDNAQHNSVEDCRATLYCYQKMQEEEKTSNMINREPLYGLIYNWKGLKEENYIYTRSQLEALDEDFDPDAEQYDGAIAANKTYTVFRLQGSTVQETEQKVRDFLTGKLNDTPEDREIAGWYWETVTEDFFTGYKNQTAEWAINYFGLRDDQLRLQDEPTTEAETTASEIRPYWMTEKDLRVCYGYQGDDLHALGVETAKLLSRMGMTIYSFRDDATKEKVTAEKISEKSNELFGVEKQEWNSFLASEAGMRYLSTRKVILSAVNNFVLIAGDKNFDDEAFGILKQGYAEELDAMANIPVVSAADEVTDIAENILDEQAEWLFNCMPADKGPWSLSALKAELVNYLPDDDLKTQLILQAARDKAHAAGLPFSERFYDGEEEDLFPFVYDGSMSVEDFQLREKLIEQDSHSSDVQTNVRTPQDGSETSDGPDETIEPAKNNDAPEPVDYEDAVINRVNDEFEAFKSGLLSLAPEEVFNESYKIHVYTELKETIALGAENGDLELGQYKALYSERGNILNELYLDFIEDESASVNTFGDTAEFIRNFCDRNYSEIEILHEPETQPAEVKRLEGNKYLTETARGDTVVSIARDSGGRNIAVVRRKNDYTVAIGYSVEDGTWAQGRYGFETEEAANEYRANQYMNAAPEQIQASTQDKSETTKEKKNISVTMQGVEKRGDYGKSILFGMPKESAYADYSFYMPASVVTEQNGIYTASLWPQFEAKLSNRSKQTMTLSVDDFAAQFAPAKAEEPAKEDHQFKYIAIPKEAVMKQYESSTMLKMPNSGEWANNVYYLPNGLIKPGKDNATVGLIIPQNFTIRLQKRKEKVTLTREEFIDAMKDVTAEDFHQTFVRPSEAAFSALKARLIKNIPEEMKQRPNWVAVKTVAEEGKAHLGKKLIDCHNGGWAKSSDPKTWTDFDSALAYAEKNGADTIAYALTGQDRIACIDVDSCINEDGTFSQEAINVYGHADGTYCERSISGKGLHFFGTTSRSDDLKSFSKDGTVEFYRKGHFISMTGDIETGCSALRSFDTPEMSQFITENFERRPVWSGQRQGQQGISKLSDQQVLDKAFASKNGDTIKALYNGEDLFRDRSRSDMALMSHLAYWTNGDVDQMLRIFATSGLFRPDKAPAYYETTAMKCVQNRVESNFASRNAGSGNFSTK